MNQKYYFSIKEFAAAIGRSRWYVQNMIAGGFEFPATVEEAALFIREYPYPSRFRKKKQTKHHKAT